MTRLQGQNVQLLTKTRSAFFKGAIFEILSLYQATGPVACIYMYNLTMYNYQACDFVLPVHIHSY